MPKVVLYCRVSTNHQTVENQLIELRVAAHRMGYSIVAELIDNGISGAKGRDDRPAFNRLHQMIQRKEIDCVMAWSICRLGRSTTDLSSFMTEVQASGVDLYIHQQSINTSTPAGRMVFGIFSALASWEREMIAERIYAGLARAKAAGKKLGRPSLVNENTKVAVKLLREKGTSIHNIAKQLKIGVGTTQRILAA
jgi:DNA invertase Pin-like site-specific DNA recombinase